MCCVTTKTSLTGDSPSHEAYRPRFETPKWYESNIVYRHGLRIIKAPKTSVYIIPLCVFTCFDAFNNSETLLRFDVFKLIK